MAGCSTPRPSISAKRRRQAFETEGLIGTGRRARRAGLSVPPHRGPARRPPTLLIIDEGWLALDDEGFAGQLREWLKTLRKKNASVIFATQSLSDIDGSSIAPGHHRKLPDAALPAERARDRAADHRDLPPLRPQRPPDRDPRRATPKRDYYCQSRRGNRLFELGLSEVALALCAASSKTDQPASPNRRRARPRRLPRRLAAPSRRRLGGRSHSRTSPTSSPSPNEESAMT
jgi:hypothetical protein